MLKKTVHIALRGALALGLACVLAGASFPSEHVLCIGSDGHVAVEPAVSGLCIHPGESLGLEPDRILSALREASGSGCGPCKDTPLPRLAVTIVARGNVATLVPAPGASASQVSHHQVLPESRLIPRPPSEVSASRAPEPALLTAPGPTLTTIVLLC